MPETIATIIAVSTEAMILFHSKDDMIALLGLPVRRQRSGAGGARRLRRGRRKSDSRGQLTPIIAVPASKQTGHVVAARRPGPQTPGAPPIAARSRPAPGRRGVR